MIEPISGHNMDSDRANLIWKCLVKYFGQDFFLESIEREYGISPEGNRQLLAQIKEMYRLSVDQYIKEIDNLQVY
jgi:hypothetical protein